MINKMKLSKPSMFIKKKSLKEKSARCCGSKSSARAVRFAQTDNERETVTICHIPSLSQMSEEEINNSWYNETEFKIMKLGIVQILRKVIAGTYQHNMDSLETEARGLENKTPKGSDARKKNRYAALFAVLDEQERQREYGLTVDPEYIAKLYRQSSAHCQMKAIQIAANDAKLFYSDNEVSFYSPKMNRKLLVPPVSPPPSRPTLACSIVSPHNAISRRHLLTMMS